MENFEDVRKLPTGRGSLFIPQLMVEKEYMKKPDDAKSVTLKFDQELRQALFDLQIPNEKHTDVLRIASSVNDSDYRDPYMLTIAAYIISVFPNGITEAPHGTLEGVLPIGSLKRFVEPFLSRIVYKKTSSSYVSSSVDTENVQERIARSVADILAYYQILNML